MGKGQDRSDLTDAQAYLSLLSTTPELLDLSHSGIYEQRHEKNLSSKFPTRSDTNQAVQQ